METAYALLIAALSIFSLVYAWFRMVRPGLSRKELKSVSRLAGVALGAWLANFLWFLTGMAKFQTVQTAMFLSLTFLILSFAYGLLYSVLDKGSSRHFRYFLIAEFFLVIITLLIQWRAIRTILSFLNMVLCSQISSAAASVCGGLRY